MQHHETHEKRVLKMNNFLNKHSCSFHLLFDLNVELTSLFNRSSLKPTHVVSAYLNPVSTHSICNAPYKKFQYGTDIKSVGKKIYNYKYILL